MEFQEFWKERERMCDYYKGQCKDNKCPLFKVKSRQYHHNCLLNCGDFPKEVEQIVEQWAKEYPVVTNGDKFREVFGFDIAMASVLLNEEWLNQEYKESR